MGPRSGRPSPFWHFRVRTRHAAPETPKRPGRGKDPSPGVSRQGGRVLSALDLFRQQPAGDEADQQPHCQQGRDTAEPEQEGEGQVEELLAPAVHSSPRYCLIAASTFSGPLSPESYHSTAFQTCSSRLIE